MPILPYLDHQPVVDDGVWLADSAYVIGKVQLAGPAWLGASAVARGDQNAISIGPRFRMGVGSTVHVEVATPTVIGRDVWLGDRVVVHATRLGDGVRVEDRAAVLSASTVGEGSIVSAGALVPEGSAFPANSYISGIPGRRQRDTTEAERAETRRLVAEALEATQGIGART